MYVIELLNKKVEKWCKENLVEPQWSSEGVLVDKRGIENIEEGLVDNNFLKEKDFVIRYI